VNPTTKIRPPIDMKFTVNNGTATEEQAPQAGDIPLHHSPIYHLGSSSSSREDRMLEQMQLKKRAIWEHIQMQQSETHRGMMHIKVSLKGNPIPISL